MKIFKTLFSAMMALFVSSSPILAEDGAYALNFTMNDIDGNPVNLSQYEGKVVMIVNVASKCGLTPQYEDLQAIYEEYKDQGFVVLGFPANNFMGQEPGSNEEIKTFCTNNYNVSFDMFSKISVKGDDIHPLYALLTSDAENKPYDGEIGWNFTKFLLNKDGKVVARFEPKTTPSDETVKTAIQTELAK
jgi:glutathione peroxidase